MIRHVVMWRFRDGEREAMLHFLEGLQGLQGVIPEILRSEVGVNINDKNSYDAVYAADFESMEALERYRKDPRHLAVSAQCKSIREARACVDYEVKA